VNKKSLFSKTAVVAFAMIVGLGAGCAKKKPDPMHSVSGTITKPEHLKLSDGAVAHVRLADVTKGYVESETVVQRTVRPAEDGTIPFELTYKESQLAKNRKYAVDARIVDKGTVYVIGGKKHPVLEGGAKDDTVEMQLDRGSKF
jgi:uncharacterized lipoprotein YbaY